MPGWVKHKLESRLLGEISVTSDNADNTTFMAENVDELKNLLMKVKEESEKADLKLNIQDFPRGPVAKTLWSQCRGPGFDPWTGT